jgi:hypothetical protein
MEVIFSTFSTNFYKQLILDLWYDQPNLKMKNYIKLLLIVFAIPMAISSCKDDDEGGSPIGTWKTSSYTNTECADPDDNGSITCTSNCEVIIITENSIKFGSDPAEPLTISGNTFTVDGESGTFVATGSTLTITFKDPGDCKTVVVYTKA